MDFIHGYIPKQSLCSKIDSLLWKESCHTNNHIRTPLMIGGGVNGTWMVLDDIKIYTMVQIIEKKNTGVINLEVNI